MVKLSRNWLHDLKVVRDRMIRNGQDVPTWKEATQNPAVRNKLLSMVGKDYSTSAKGRVVRRAGLGPYSRTAVYGPGIDNSFERLRRG